MLFYYIVVYRIVAKVHSFVLNFRGDVLALLARWDACQNKKLKMCIGWDHEPNPHLAYSGPTITLCLS